MKRIEPLLILKNLEYHRDGFRLQIDRLILQSGGIYLLTGANGSGKSTLLHLLALLLKPRSGEVFFAGEPVVHETQRLRLRSEVTLVEQQPYLFDASVYQNLAFGLRLRRVEAEQMDLRIREALRMVGLEGFEFRRARTLSGGESRRVALARAMVLRPKLLLLDEPTAGLDRETLPVFEECLAALPAQGTTLVIAGHDGDQPRRLSGTVLELERGRLLPGTATVMAQACL